MPDHTAKIVVPDAEIFGPDDDASEPGDDATAALRAELEAARAGQARAVAERDALLHSATWRATQPLRRMGNALPGPARRLVRRSLRAGYWIATRQFGRRIAEWRASRPALLAAVAQPEAPPTPIAPAPGAAAEEADYDRWVREHDTLTDDDRVAIAQHIGRLTRRPLISVVIPAYKTPEHLLRAAIASVRAQLYPDWELCIADDASPSSSVARVIAEAAAEDPRIRWLRRDRNGHIAAATNSAITLATGEFVALMDHDDLLPEQALYEVAVELDAHPDTDVIYTDEDHIDLAGHRSQPYFKPDWNIDLLLGHNMVSHLGVYRRSLLERIGGLRGGPADGSQDYDLALRAGAATTRERIRHIPAILYHWRRTDEAQSFSQAQFDRCVAAAHWAIRDHLSRQGVAGAQVLPAPAVPGWTRIRWPFPDPAPKVTVIVPTRDRADLLARCVSGLLLRTDYPDLELLIADNGSAEPETLGLLDRLTADRRVRVLSLPGPFNYSALNNAAVAEASGSIIVLVNNDIDVIEAGWLREMVSLAVRPDVGAVGAKLLYADGRIQHAGVVLGLGSSERGPGVAGHFGNGHPRGEIGYFGQHVLAREVSAVTGACMALRRDVYQAAGGLDAENLPVSFNDVDLCLRIRARGLRVIWTPFAELYHLESASRGRDRTPDQRARATREANYMLDRWGEALDRDPFYNPNFDLTDPTRKLAMPPRREKPWRR